MNKVSAFTVLEMLVNLTIMAIIMGLIYFAYSSFVYQVTNYRYDMEERNRISRGYVQMKIDFYKADKIVYSFKKCKVVFYDNSYVTYRFLDNYLIRQQETVTDTMDVKNITYETERSKVTNEELVTELAIETTLFKEPIVFTVYKQYPMNVTMKM